MRQIIKISGHLCSSELPAIQEVLEKFSSHYTIDVIGKKIVIEDKAVDAVEIAGVLLEKGIKARAEGIKTAETSSDLIDKYGTPSIALACLILIIFKVYIVAIIIGCIHVLPKAVKSIRGKRVDINVLMMIAVVGAVIIEQHFEGAMVIFLYIVAHMLEEWSGERARKAVEKLLDLAPTTALLEDGKEIPVDEVEVGMRIQVRPGDKIPIDGVIVSGESMIDQAPLTGESVPIEKGPADPVFSGTINQSGALLIETTKVASDSTLARIIYMIQNAQGRRALIRQWVDKFAHIYTPCMIAIAVLIAVVPPIFKGQWMVWFYEALVILVIACPCALVISTPVTIVSALSSAARNGILVKGGIFMEIPSKLKGFAFDKTGTLTHGKPVVQEVYPFDLERDKALALAAALASNSVHPLSQSIVKLAEKEGVTIPQGTNFSEWKGQACKLSIDDTCYYLGSKRHAFQKGIVQPEVQEKLDELEAQGVTLSLLSQKDKTIGIITFKDTPRENAADVISALKQRGLKTFMLTGDNKGVAKQVAKTLGVDEYYAELLPEDKVNTIHRLENTYHHIGMVGDGINDAPAMAASSLSIAMGAAGTDVAIEAADVALMTDNLSRIPQFVDHSKRTIDLVKQNIGFSLVVKGIFLILALLKLATLWMAIAADTGASIVVVFNGMRMLRFRR